MNTSKCEDSITLEILDTIDAKSDSTQRHIAQRTGAALEVANSYLKRCIRKGLIKIQQAPANRYLYYLTPKGLAEKSRLTREYLSCSLTLYRQAGDEFRAEFRAGGASGHTGYALYGVGDLAEIAVIRAMEQQVGIVAVCDPRAKVSRFLDRRVIKHPEGCGHDIRWAPTDLNDPRKSFTDLVDAVGRDRIFVPEILGLRDLTFPTSET